jgi:hypothetical protein
MQSSRFKDYMPSVWGVAILYLLGWLPGFLGNLCVLLFALFDDYDEQEGLGCLVGLFVVVGCIPLAFAYVVGVAFLHALAHVL